MLKIDLEKLETDRNQLVIGEILLHASSRFTGRALRGMDLRAFYILLWHHASVFNNEEDCARYEERLIALGA